MDIIIDVIDSMSSAPLPGATISVNGRDVGQADANGVYQADNLDESDEITVSYVGYPDYKIAAGILEGSGQVQMARSSDVLPTVTVTPSPKAANYLPWLIGGGITIALLSGNKKSVGAAKNKTALYIGAGALGLGAIYFITRPKTTTPISQIPLSTSQLVAQQASSPASALSNLFGSGSSGLFKSISNLFSSTPAAGTPGSFLPVGITDTSYNADPTVNAPTYIDPSSGLNLDFSNAPGN